MVRSGYANVFTITHAQHFIDPVHTDIHTQTTEGLWMQAKWKVCFQAGHCFPVTLQNFSGAIAFPIKCMSMEYGQHLKLVSESDYAV